MTELSQLSGAMLKLRCVEFGSSPSLLSPASSSDSAADFCFYGKEPSETTADSGLSSDTDGCTPPPSQRPPRKAARSANSSDDSRSDVSADSLAEERAGRPLSPAMNKRKKKKLPGNLMTEIRQKASEMQLLRQKKQLVQLQQQKMQPVRQPGQHQQQQQTAQHPTQPALPVKLRKSNTSPSLMTQNRNLVLSLPAIPAHRELDEEADGAHQRFHLCEYQSPAPEKDVAGQRTAPGDDLSFVGVRDILNVQSGGLTIRSHKSGTVRGVRNRVRAGITTFLQGNTFKVSGRVVDSSRTRNSFRSPVRFSAAVFLL